MARSLLKIFKIRESQAIFEAAYKMSIRFVKDTKKNIDFVVLEYFSWRRYQCKAHISYLVKW